MVLAARYHTRPDAAVAWLHLAAWTPNLSDPRSAWTQLLLLKSPKTPLTRNLKPQSPKSEAFNPERNVKEAFATAF